MACLHCRFLGLAEARCRALVGLEVNITKMHCCMWFLSVTPVEGSEVEETETTSEVVDEPEPAKFVEANVSPAPGVETYAYFPKSPSKGKWPVGIPRHSFCQEMEWSEMF